LRRMEQQAAERSKGLAAIFGEYASREPVFILKEPEREAVATEHGVEIDRS
jgi:hypothetical protein